MKRLLVLTDSQQENPIKALLDSNGITYRQTEPGFFDRASIWVIDSDYPKARELLEEQILVDEKLAKIQFNEEWITKWNGSYIYWFLGSILEDPLRLFKLILLVVLAAVFIGYPVYLIFNKF